MCPKEQQTSDNLIVKDYYLIIEIFDKGPVKLIKRVEIAHSFLHSLSDRSVPRYHFKLAYVILQMAAKKFFVKPSSKTGEIGHFNLQNHF